MKKLLIPTLALTALLTSVASYAGFSRAAEPVTSDSNERIIYEDEDYDVLERQAMEDVDYRSYPKEKYESEEDRLNRLEKENAIFYGNPSATGASGSPGSYELTK